MDPTKILDVQHATLSGWAWVALVAIVLGAVLVIPRLDSTIKNWLKRPVARVEPSTTLAAARESLMASEANAGALKALGAQLARIEALLSSDRCHAPAAIAESAMSAQITKARDLQDRATLFGQIERIEAQLVKLFPIVEQLAQRDIDKNERFIAAIERLLKLSGKTS